MNQAETQLIYETALQTLQKNLPVQVQRQTEDTLQIGGEVLIRMEAVLHRQEQELLVLHFYIALPDAQEPVITYAVGAGESLAQMAQTAAMRLLADELTPVLRFLGQKDGRRIDRQFDGELRSWMLYPGDLLEFVELQQGLDGDALLKTVQEGLLERLGNQRYTWVQLSSMKEDELVVTACAINGERSEQLGELLKEQACSWEGNCTCRQSLLLVREEPFAAYPYSRAQIKEFTQEALRLFEDCPYEKIADRLAQQIGDQQLAEDLFSYLPELCAAREYPEVKQQEYLFLVQEGEEPLLVYKNQLTAWNWISRSLEALFDAGQVSQVAQRRCVEYSSLYDAIQEAKRKGKSLAGGSITLAIPVSGDYRIR